MRLSLFISFIVAVMKSLPSIFFCGAACWGSLLLPTLGWAQADEVIELERFVVTASLREEPLLRLPVSITLLETNELNRFGQVFLSDALVDVPGMVLETQPGRVQAPRLRGTRPGQTLMLVDGRRLAPGFRLTPDAGQFALGGVDRVEVIRGPFSALHGSDAVGGVVNVLTLRGADDSPMVNAALRHQFGDWEEQSGFLGAGHDVGKLNFFANLSFRQNTDWEAGDGPPEDVDEVTSEQGWLNVDYQLTERAKLSASVSQQTTERIGQRPTAGGAERTADDERQALSLAWEQQWSSATELTLRAYLDRYEADVSFDLRPNQAARFNEALETEIRVLDGFLSHAWTESWVVTGGFEWLETRYTNLREDALPARGAPEVTNHALFAQGQWRKGAWDAIVGARFDDQSEFGEELSPQLAVGYTLAEGWQLRASYGEGFRAPSVVESLLTTFERGGRVTVLPNEMLDAERSRSVEVGIVYTDATWQTALTGFTTTVDDLISQVTLSAPNPNNVTRVWENVDEVEIEGMEFSTRWQPIAALNLSGYLTWLQSENAETGETLEGEREWTARLVAQGLWEARRLSATVALQWVGEETGPASVAEDAGATVDAEIAWHATDALRFSLGARNLFDETDTGVLPVRYFFGLTINH